MESIDALAMAINEYKGGMVLVSHDMRLISQVAKEIWICDDKTITKHKGDIQSFKMDMRAQMGIDGEQAGSKSLRGDASTAKKDAKAKAPAPPKKKAAPKIEVVAPPAPSPPKVIEDDATATTVQSASTTSSDKPRYVPMHLRGSSGASASGDGDGAAPAPRGRYVPPHLR